MPPPSPPPADSVDWDETLYAGSATYYARGRIAYPFKLAAALRDELGLDGSGRLLDVGCGPGSLTLLLAPLFAEIVGVDADAAMLAEAERRSASVEKAKWLRLRAEELPAALGAFDVVTFAQSFHWMDQSRVAPAVRGMLRPGGAWVHVHATTHRGFGGEWPAPHDRIDALVAAYLGPVRRAGSSTLPDGTVTGEEDVLLAAGFSEPTRLTVPGRVVERDVDDVVASVFSRSSSAPHLFGDDLAEFERELRNLLHAESHERPFRELTREIDLVVWRP